MNKNGFTLIEIIVSVIIILVIVSSITYLFKTSLSSLSTNTIYQSSIFQAQSKMEEIRSIPFNQIKSVVFENGSGKIIVTPIYTDLIEIKLSLNWLKDKKPIELCTLRSKY